MTDQSAQFDIEKIFSLLPHRFPFILVDRVMEWEPFSYIHAYKNVTINEPFFQGHFPEKPIMPGVLILEALAQAGGLLALSSINVSTDNHLFLFTGINKVKFRRQVIPGDRLDLFCSDMHLKMNFCKMTVEAKVDGKVACEGEISAAIGKKPSKT